MKRPTLTLALAGMLSTILFPSCLEIKTTTRLNRDGSLQRTVSFTGDSSSVNPELLPFTIDPTWSSATERPEDQKLRLTATKTFRGAAELNSALQGERAKRIHVTVELEETFWWFYTEYEYRETYHAVNVFDRIPFTDHLSPEELETLLWHEENKKPVSSEDSLSLSAAQERFEEWYARTIFESYYEAFLEGVRILNDPTLAPPFVEERKAILFRESRERVEAGEFERVDAIFEEVLKTRRVRDAFKAGNQARQGFDVLREFQDRVLRDSYEVNVEMPGLITNTNAASIEGARAQWSDFILRAFLTDYTMWVSSRAVNWWAVILTGSLILAGAIGLAAVSLRRRGRI